ncbi:Hypothetical Protein FCC1311_042292 [Hondaea fermentalgiana]|uniref:Uncharacterized protein n=1 Tax=Hondaea fermentalgiana TaxID=2315210 RepID=A0A2R5GAE9_9STRA|nr:Hypothetical Protein FCC1311_042292 [Hondaea fermentalgiana]|eukprot:GBG28006.1 Hypothetical Protein FCC1311_042292 [Hondaea fermentalgiana]
MPKYADRQQESGQLNVHEFDTFDYERIKEETDYRITLKMLQRWFTWGGRIHAAFEKLRNHARALRRQGFDFSKLHLSWAGFRQIDEASTRCLERMDTIRELLRRFDLQNATTAVMAAMRFRKLSPKGGVQLAPRR